MHNHLRKALQIAANIILCGIFSLLPLQLATAAENNSAFYQEMYQHMVQREENFTINYAGSYTDIYDGDNFENLMNSVMNLHQDNSSDDFDYLRWNYKTVSFTCSNNEDNTSNFNFEVTYREPAEWLNYVNQNIQTILPGLLGNDDLQTIKNIHDFVVNQIEYDRTMQRYTAYDGLHLKSTVCQGYSLLTYKLLTEAGIPCRIISGYAGERHSWNIIKLGDAWYHLDCTWDDPISNQPVLRYDYFLIGTDRISKDHTMDPEWLNAASMQQYPLSRNDFNADYIAQENKESMDDEVYQAVTDRENFHKALSDALNEAFAYDAQDRHRQAIFDLYKRIILSAVQGLSDNEFFRLVQNDNYMDRLSALAEKHVNQRILDPLIAYTDSPEFEKAGEKKFMDFCSRHDVEQMDPATWEKLSAQLAQQWANEIMEAEIARISQQNTTAAIEALQQDLQTTINHE